MTGIQKEKDEKQFQDIYRELSVPLNCPGIKWRYRKTWDGVSDGDFDLELLPLLKEFNQSNYCHTTGSCAGHSLSEIKKQKKGWFVEVPYRMTVTVHVRFDKIPKFQEAVSALDEISNGSLWCQLGYHYDMNFQTEKNYVPFEIIVYCRSKKRRDSLVKKYVQKLSEL